VPGVVGGRGDPKKSRLGTRAAAVTRKLRAAERITTLIPHIRYHQFLEELQALAADADLRALIEQTRRPLNLWGVGILSNRDGREVMLSLAPQRRRRGKTCDAQLCYMTNKGKTYRYVNVTELVAAEKQKPGRLAKLFFDAVSTSADPRATLRSGAEDYVVESGREADKQTKAAAHELFGMIAAPWEGGFGRGSPAELDPKSILHQVTEVLQVLSGNGE